MRIGIDMGGTKIEVIALDEGGGTLLRRRVPTPSGYEAGLDAVQSLVEGAEAELGRRGTVGVGIPGAISPASGLVKNANSTWLIGKALDRDLAERLRRPVRLMNDANCFALSEAVDGAAAGAEVVFGAILGTGVGGGMVVRGRPLVGATRIAGEWGHNPLPWPREDELPGPLCYCGNQGCIETFCSGPALERDHLARTGRTLRGIEISAAAEAGDAEARRTLDRHLDRLARSLATVINVLDPDVVVLGGGVSNLPDLPARLGGELPRWVFSDEVATRVVRNQHGDSSGVRGAAWLWPEGAGGSDDPWRAPHP